MLSWSKSALLHSQMSVPQHSQQVVLMQSPLPENQDYPSQFNTGPKSLNP